MADPVAATPDERAQAAAFLAAALGKGSPSVAAPATQKYIAMVDDKIEGGIRYEKNPNYTEPKVTPQSPVNVPGVGMYGPDPTAPGGWGLIVSANAPNADEEIGKYLTREQNEQLRTQRQNNESRGFGYATDDEVIKRSNEAQQLGINKADSVLKYRDLDEKQRQFDITAKRDDAKAAQDILQSQATVGQIGASTVKTGAETAGLTQTTAQQAQLFPTTLAQAQATQAGTEASTRGTEATTANQLQATKIAGAPQVATPPTGMSQWTRNPLTGELTQGGINPEYQAKTQADVAARVGQIQSLARAKQQELLTKAQKSGGSYSADQATTDFNQWWDSNVEPQVGPLKAAQAQAAAEQARLDQTQRQQAMQTSLGAGTQAISAFTASQAGRVGPDIGQAMKQAGQGKFDFSPDAFRYTAPDINQTAPQSVMDALKYISPTAAQATGAPMPDYGAVNVPDALNRTQYGFGGGAQPMPMPVTGGAPNLQANPMPMPAPAPVPAPAAAAAPAAPGAPGSPGFDWTALFSRLGNPDVRQAQVAAMGQNPYVYGGA